MSARGHRATGRVLALLLAAACALWVWWVPAGDAQAENRVTMRGQYYRETSTRILQPQVTVTADAPDERLTLGAGYLLDAISSASIASGAAQITGGDKVFHELRHEVTGTVGSRLGEWTLGGFFRYSTETDYISRATGVSLARDLLQRNINLALSYSVNLDRWYRIVNNLGVRQPWCGGAVPPQGCSKGGVGIGSNFLQVHLFGLNYAHALHKTVLASFHVNYAHQVGPQDNPYREGLLGGIEETHPRIRNRVVLTPSVRWAIPKARLVIEPFYAFYVDDWGMRSHSPELRVHGRVARHVLLRGRYRYYKQTAAFFWRKDGQYVDGDAQCTRQHPDNCATADVKVMPWDSHTPGVQLVWEFDGIARHKGLHWLEGGFVEVTYNHAFQHNRYGNARIGNLALSLAF